MLRALYGTPNLRLPFELAFWQRQSEIWKALSSDLSVSQIESLRVRELFQMHEPLIGHLSVVKVEFCQFLQVVNVGDP